MDNDDQPIGTILNRRDVLKLLGFTGGAAILAGCLPGQQSTPVTANATATSETAAGLPTCIVRPAMTEGPYFVDEKLNRSDIRAGSAGIPLELTFLVSQISANACTPLAGALVDIWHCDAQGVYSDVAGNTDTFLRGYQETDATGAAKFLTIYPGWYPGRTPHIHFKIRTADGYDFTSQLFFDDAISDTVFNLEPYQRG